TTALNEKGELVNGVGDSPNQHDILTGSTPDGRAFTHAAADTRSNSRRHPRAQSHLHQLHEQPARDAAAGRTAGAAGTVGHARSSRSSRRAERVVERRAREPGLQPAESGVYGGGPPSVLLRAGRCACRTRRGSGDRKVTSRLNRASLSEG